ncbi:hypothetical protein AJ80_03257 [Polytolypa hystricis UAMH7299]|uniref:Uncharacterized protein n=1 Tax=Polytolypa hystricis (strain UAMH7299) TaxID=1447883 RepID=A0A2B7YIT1_POLH7|nr:hypothetical protein AJ80_03257 [Polytolypa hystricis UAMH7299]
MGHISQWLHLPQTSCQAHLCASTRAYWAEKPLLRPLIVLQHSTSSTIRSSIKSDGPPNIKKTFIGKLDAYSGAYNPPPANHGNASGSRLAALTGKVDEKASEPLSKKKKKEERDLNPDGSNTGNLTEDAIMLSGRIVAEAEHRCRYKILDILQEIGENADA